MSIKNQVLVVVLCFFLFFGCIRWFLLNIIHYCLNKSARRKRKKGQTFKEWLLYSRYKNEIPKPLIILYYIICIIHPLTLILIGFAAIFNNMIFFTTILTEFIFAFNLIWLALIYILFWGPGKDFKYERWISRKGGNRKKK